MRGLFFALLIASPMLLSGMAHAEDFDHGSPLEELGKEIKIERLIIDHAVTFAGHEFYRSFVTEMNKNTIDTHFDQLVIEERAYAVSGSLVSVEYKNRRIFQTVVYAGPTNIEKIGSRAASIVKRYLGRQQLSSLLFRNPDLAQDEIE